SCRTAVSFANVGFQLRVQSDAGLPAACVLGSALAPWSGHRAGVANDGAGQFFTAYGAGGSALVTGYAAPGIPPVRDERFPAAGVPGGMAGRYATGRISLCGPPGGTGETVPAGTAGGVCRARR